MIDEDLNHWKITNHTVSSWPNHRLTKLLLHKLDDMQCGVGEQDWKGRWHCGRCGRRVPKTIEDLCLLGGVFGR